MIVKWIDINIPGNTFIIIFETKSIKIVPVDLNCAPPTIHEPKQKKREIDDL